jgi:Peptidase M66
MGNNLRDLILRDTVLRTDLLDRFRLLRLYVEGVEVSQAIQYYNSSEHLTDPADRAPDNAVTLIAGKPAWVRVYVRSLLLNQITGVTGTLEVMRREVFFIYNSVGAISPQAPGTVTARNNPNYATERSTITSTLNFILPADYMCGHLRLVVRVNAPGGYTDEFTIDINATLRQTLRLAGIMVGYNGPSSSAPNAPNLTLAAPTIANLQTTAGWTLLTFPVRSAATYRSAGTITWTQPLTDAPSCAGCCTPNWVALNAAVQAQRVADGNRTDVLYYGLMAAGIPMGPIIGCNTGGVSTGSNNDGVTMAHELGHACGLPHAPCGTPGDPNYPAYEPYDPANTPQASIGEYGLDISNGNIMSPATFKDMMAYCGPRWISLYNYGRLTNNTNLDPIFVCIPHHWWEDYVVYDPLLIPEKWLPNPPPDPLERRVIMQLESVISIIGVVHSEDEVEIRSIMRLDAMRETRNARSTGLTAELVNAQGRIVSRAPVQRLRSYGHGGGCGCTDEEMTGESRFPYMFQAFVSDVEPGAVLRIRGGGKELWRRGAPDEEPRITKFRATLSRGKGKEARRGEHLVAEWQVKHAGEEEPEYWLQWSNDGGKNWHALAAGLRGESATLDSSVLPSGRVAIRLLVSDGFHTATSKNVAVEIPKRPASVSILSPRENQAMLAGFPMRLYGAATLSNGELAPERNARWLMDGKAIAENLDAFITAPNAGEHRLTLIVSAKGEETEQTIRFRTIKVPDEHEQNKEENT